MALKKKKEQDRPLYETLPPVHFKAMGAESRQLDEGNLLAAKQMPGFPIASGLMAHALISRATRIMLDYTKTAVAVRYDVDGIWMNVDPQDRPTGDAMLVVLKKLANLNIEDRQSRQEGKFSATFHGFEYICSLLTQGVKTGERVLIKIEPKKAQFETLEDLGMRKGMRERFKELIDQPQGFAVISAPPGHGVTTLWSIAVNTADRFVRDFISIEDQEHPEPEVINVGPVFYDSKAGQKPADILPKLLLKQPDVFVVPDLHDGKTTEILCKQVTENRKMIITRVRAREAAEAIMRILAYKAPPKLVADSLTFVLNCRLVRKLCEGCKQPFQPQPQLLQKLGIPPTRVSVLYREFQPPPPEQRVDEKGRPIEIEICQQCNGLGYRGRTGIFEMMVINDAIRNAIVQQPTLENIRRAAKASGHRTLQDEGILLVAQGITSLQELQRALKQT